MRESTNQASGETRREFMKGAGIAAGGAALIGANLASGAEALQDNPPGGQPGMIRATAPIEKHLANLGPLKELGGTWVGKGFNLISLPDFQNPGGGHRFFRVKLNATVENLQFTQIGGPIPNRGSIAGNGGDPNKGQKDLSLFGVTYLQRVSDATTFSALHIEPGIWLHVPASDIPAQPATVVRQGSIPHGTSVLAQGKVIDPVPGGPIIKAVDSTPSRIDGKPFPLGYLDPLLNPQPLPPGIKPQYVKNPNLFLLDSIADQKIVKTEVLDISTVTDPNSAQVGGTLNIPFLQANANATQFSAIFWIETVEQQDAPPFMQLQYTQTVILDFLDIHWPHISVATLVKQ